MLILNDHELVKSFDTIFKSAAGDENTKSIMNSPEVYNTSPLDPVDLYIIE